MTMNSRGTSPSSAKSSKCVSCAIQHCAALTLIDRRISQEQVSGRLSPNDFPYLREAPTETPLPAHVRPTAVSSHSSNNGGSLRSARPTWHKAPAARVQATTESRQRIILFVAGGMTFSEQRLAYLIGDSLNKEVIIGGCTSGTLTILAL